MPSKLKPYHHIRPSKENVADSEMWLSFLRHPSVFARPFMDFLDDKGQEVDFFSDASKNPELGMGAKCQKLWLFLQWDSAFLRKVDPSIEYLELYALTAAVLCWLPRYKNRRITIFCDNMSVVWMINKTTSSCRNCMVLIYIIVLQSLIHNVRLYATYVPSQENVVSDLLSRLKFKKFALIQRQMNLEDEPTAVPEVLLPMENIWINE